MRRMRRIPACKTACKTRGQDASCQPGILRRVLICLANLSTCSYSRGKRQIILGGGITINKQERVRARAPNPLNGGQFCICINVVCYLQHAYTDMSYTIRYIRYGIVRMSPDTLDLADTVRKNNLIQNSYLHRLGERIGGNEHVLINRMPENTLNFPHYVFTLHAFLE